MDRFYLWFDAAVLVTVETLNGTVLYGEEDALDFESTSLSSFASSVPVADLLHFSLGPNTPKHKFRELLQKIWPEPSFHLFFIQT